MSPIPRPRRPAATLVSLGVVLAAAVGIGLSACAGIGGRVVDTVGDHRFTRALAIPPLADSRVKADGTRVFSLTPQEGSRRFAGGVASPTRGYDGDYLGPTLRAHRGERVEVHVRNRLRDVTTLHWHGMHLAPAVDGGPHQTIRPGKSRSPAWTVDQPAATLWYHPHPHGETEEQVSEGLAGLFLVDDDESDALRLPKRYGVDDVPVIVQDADFDRGRRVQGSGAFVGALGDRIVVNGTLDPYLEVRTDLVRLRLLDASPARPYDFAFSDGRRFTQIATDSGLLGTPRTLARLRLVPGERAEIVVRMSPGERVVLRSQKPRLETRDPFSSQSGGDDRFDVLELRATETLAPTAPLPERLVAQHPLDPSTAVRERTITMDRTGIDGREMDMGRIDQAVRIDTTEIWAIRNDSSWPHDFHVHDVRFRVLDVAGKPPAMQDRGWKDTVYLRPDATTRIIMHFADYADPAHPYMYHCHLLRHEDSGMMGQFVVLRPGDRAPTMTATTSEDHHEH